MSLEQIVRHDTATLKSDFEGSLEQLSDDVVWINLLPQNVPFGGEFGGKGEVFVISRRSRRRLNRANTSGTILTVSSPAIPL